MTAIDRHISNQGDDFPLESPVDDSRPLGPRGDVIGKRVLDGKGASVWQDDFVPIYGAYFPELSLNAVFPFKGPKRPRQIFRDLSPVETLDINGVTHGRSAYRYGALKTWITSLATHPRSASKSPAGFTSADLAHFQAKVLLRSLSAFVGKGADLVFFYENGTDLGIVDEGDATLGEPVRALARFRAAFEGPADPGRIRPLSLAVIRSCASGQIFAGDGTAAHPPLLHRDAVAFFPFQVTEKKWVVPSYIMTRDLVALRRPDVGQSVSRYDLVPEIYELQIEGINGAVAQIEALDPVAGKTVELTIRERGPNRLVVSVPLTDSVLLLTLSEP